MRFLPAIASARSHAVSWTTDQAQARLSQPRHTWAELLRDSAETKLYLDYDHVLPDRSRDAPPLTEEDEDVSTHREMVVERLCHILDLLQALARSKGVDEDAVQKMRFVIASRHGWCATKDCWKISYRPFLIGIRIQYDQIRIILGLTGQMPDMGEDSFWDLSVYKSSEQLLACINGIKSAADTRMLAACMTVPGTEGGPDFEVLDYVAQVVEQDWLCLTAPPELVEGYWKGQAERMARVARSAANPTRNPSRAQSAVPQHVLRHLVKGLAPDRADDRKRWIETVWAIRAVSANNGYEEAGEGLAQDFSRLCVAKYNSRAVSKAYSEGRSGASSGVGLGSLLFWYKEDTADRPRLFRELQAMLRASTLASAVSSVAGATTTQAMRASLLHKETEDVGQGVTCLCDDAKFETTRYGAVSSFTGTDTPLEAKLMQHLSSRWPERFVGRECKELRFDFADGHARFECGDIRGYIQDFTVYLDDDTFLGSLCLDVPVSGPLPCHKEVPARHTGFLYNRQTKELSSLHTIDPDGASLSISEYHSKDMRDSFQATVPGKQLTTIDSPAKVGALLQHLKNAKHSFYKSLFGPMFGNFFLINNGTINLHAPPPAEKAPSEFRLIREKLVEFAASKGLRKRDGLVFKPVEGCPCAFIIHNKYEEYINEVLKDDEVYNDNPRRFDEAVKYLTNYEVSKMPWLKTDLDVMSFSNGVLILSTGNFHPYEAMDPSGEMAGRVARHHIDLPYTACPDTPLLDMILAPQFDADVAEILCALLGRSFFKVGQMDEWQVMLFLVGVGGTGKSLILNIMEQLFPPGAVGNLAAKREEVFGMANLLDKEVVFGRDMPAKMSASLPQETMQAMTAGEGMEVPRKGALALNVRWTAPVIMASNHMPDYANTGNNIGRRMVSIRFDNVIVNPKEDLQRLIRDRELPNIVCRILGAYQSLRAKIRCAGGGFWASVPPKMLEWRKRLSASTNKLDEFLSMEDEDRKCSITRVEGHVTSLPDFKVAFEARMKGTSYAADPAVFASFGFAVSEKREMVCMFCAQVAKTRGGKCCELSDRDKRRPKTVIFNMKMVLCGGDELHLQQ